MDFEALYRQANELETGGQFNKAASAYRRLVNAATDARFHVAYGVCLQKLGRWRESVLQLQLGVTLKPHYCEGDARLLLAKSYLMAGKKAKAIEQWRIVAVMKPEYPSYEAVPDEAREMLNKHA